MLIGPGRYDEQLKISKPIKLVGAGPSKTVLGPTAKDREQMIETFETQGQALEEGSLKLEPAEGAKLLADWQESLAAIVTIDGVPDVEIHSLGITSPGTPRKLGGLPDGFDGIRLQGAGLRLKDCAIVGCLGNGVKVQGESNFEIDDCLIAGCWSTGVTSKYMGGRVRIVNSDIRNCYHYNLQAGTSSEEFVIEGCHISGSAWSGIIAGGRPTVARNAIFENARGGIYSAGNGVIKQNLIYKNGHGVGCRGGENTLIENNLFWQDEGVGCYVSGACDPTIRRNMFVGGKQACSYGPLQVSKSPSGKIDQQPTGKYDLTENLFWRISQPLVLRHATEQSNQWRDRADRSAIRCRQSRRRSGDLPRPRRKYFAGCRLAGAGARSGRHDLGHAEKPLADHSGRAGDDSRRRHSRMVEVEDAA